MFSTFGYYSVMDIKQDIDRFLAESGWTPYRLAKESGVNINIIRRIQLGRRQGMSSRTLGKLVPFLYPDFLSSPPTPPRDAA
ncbi:hypothetical protein DA2_3184 [Desulfovibrio sp. A2]|nr:hypothetical protein DA2_3184 [Desulfovibrio sp. A2]